MPSFSKRNIITILTLGIIVLTIPLGIQLVQTQQVLKSRASEDICDTNPTSLECRCHNESTDDDWDGPTNTVCTSCGKATQTWLNVCTNQSEEFSDQDDSSCTIGCSSSPPGVTNTLTPTPVSCNLNAFQSPSVSGQCADCISFYNPGVYDSLRIACQSTDKVKLINYWCNGGVSPGGSNDCSNSRDKKRHPACAASCSVNFGTVTLCGSVKNWADVDKELWNASGGSMPLSKFDHGAVEAAEYTKVACPARATSTPTIPATLTPTRTPFITSSVSPTAPPAGASCIPGDIDGNRCVSTDDLQRWVSLFPHPTSFPIDAVRKADVFPICRGDGNVDLNDFNVWLIEYLAGRNRC